MKKIIKYALTLVLLFGSVINLSGCGLALLSLAAAESAFPYYSDRFLPKDLPYFKETIFDVGFRDLSFYRRYYYTAVSDGFFFNTYHRVQQKDVCRLKTYFESIKQDYDGWLESNGRGESFSGELNIPFGFNYENIDTNYYYVELHDQTSVQNYDSVVEFSFDFDIMLYDPDTYTVHWIHSD